MVRPSLFEVIKEASEPEYLSIERYCCVFLTDRFPEDVDDVMRNGIASVGRVSGDERFCDHDEG